MSPASPRLAPVLLAALLALCRPACAHVLDEYVQATIVSIEPGDLRLRINLTPGVAIADQIIAVIDRDQDGSISPHEAAAYAESFRRDLVLRLDQRPISLKLIAAEVPPPPDLRTGLGIIKLEFAAVPTPNPLPPGPHQLTLENHHVPGIGVYLFNAARPLSPAIRITAQTRNLNQSTGQIDFTSALPPKLSNTTGWLAALGVLLFAVLASVWRLPKTPPASH